MAIPIGQIISAAAPLVMSALELYRRRNDATSAAGAGEGGGSLERRMQELEEADVEQSRLISELSRSLDALARAYAVNLEEGRKKDARIRQLLWAVGALAVVSVGLSIWAMAR